jgi:subtilisin family serine protease
MNLRVHKVLVFAFILAIAVSAQLFANEINLTKVSPKLVNELENREFHSCILSIEGNDTKEQISTQNRAEKLQILERRNAFAQSKIANKIKQLKYEGKIKEYYQFRLIPYISLSCSKEAIADLSNHKSISYILPDNEIQLPPVKKSARIRDENGATKHLNQIGATRVWKEYNITGKGVLAANIDTGVDPNHPDLRDKILYFKDFTDDDGPENGFDPNGHGTHTIGTMIGGNTSGTAVGVAPDAKLISAKIFKGSGSAKTSWILKAMEWVCNPDGDSSTTDDMPRLVSNSWGGRQESFEEENPMWELVRKWLELDIIPVFACGNSGPNDNTIGTPGGYPHSFAVGAVQASDYIAYFSSRGPITWDGKKYIKPDVSAPGTNVHSTWPGGGYADLDGTSMACPHVAGALCLLLQAKPELTPAKAIKLLETTAKDLGDPLKDNSYGHGRIDIYKAINKAVFDGRVMGTVTSDSKEPVESAQIDPQSPEYKPFISDEFGSFNGFIREGVYQIKASKYGFTSETKEVAVKRKQTTTVAFTLKELPMAKVTGTVKNENGFPLKAKISLLNTPIKEIKTNAEGQFSFEAAQDKYTMLIEALGYHAKKLEVELPGSFDVVLDGLPPILVIDDDQEKDYERYFLNALDSLEKRYSLYEVKGKKADGPDATFLCQYPLVIWFTGDDIWYNLTRKDTESLEVFLKAGGKLFLTGQDIAYNLRKKHFLVNYLGCEIIKDAAFQKTVTGPVNVDIVGGDGAYNQFSSDVINPVADGQRLFEYTDGTCAGVKCGNVIFLSFGYESIATAWERQKMMKWALTDLTNETPQLTYYLTFNKFLSELKSAKSESYSALLDAEFALRTALKLKAKNSASFTKKLKELEPENKLIKILLR